MGSNKLLLKSIGPFRVLRRLGNAYTIDLPRKMSTHPTFYVGHHDRTISTGGDSSGEESPCAQSSPTDTCAHDISFQPAFKIWIPPRKAERYPDELPSARSEDNAVSAHSQVGQRDTLPCPSKDLNSDDARLSRVRYLRATHTLRGRADSQHQIGSANR